MKYLEHITAATQCHTAIYLLSSRNNNNIYKLTCLVEKYLMQLKTSIQKEDNKIEIFELL